jgi:DnaJ-class molecular chaperone
MHQDWDNWARNLPQTQNPQPTQGQTRRTFTPKERNGLEFIRYLRAQGKMRDDCPDCAGTGVIGDGYPCPSCKD